jgi:hypothetical protein
VFVRIEWKSLQMTNTLAYCVVNYGHKEFYNIGLRLS